MPEQSYLFIERIELEPHGTPHGDDHLLLVRQVRAVDHEETAWGQWQKQFQKQFALCTAYIQYRFILTLLKPISNGFFSKPWLGCAPIAPD